MRKFLDRKSRRVDVCTANALPATAVASVKCLPLLLRTSQTYETFYFLLLRMLQDVPMATAVSLPGASDHPMYNNGGNKARDLWAALLFWAHLLAIIAVGFALGPKAVNTDSGAVENDPNRPVLHINAYTMFKVVVASCAVSAVVAAGAFALLKRAGGAMIRAALWINFAVLAIMAGL